MLTQQQIDGAYEAGKRAWFRAFGTHGPTVRATVPQTPDNPFDGLLGEAWSRGYRQDVRRVHAPVVR